MIINTVNIQDGPVASGKLANNTNIVYTPASSLGVNLFQPLGGYNYKDKYIFSGQYTGNLSSISTPPIPTSVITRFNDLNDLTNYTTVTFTGYTQSTLAIDSLGVDGKIYVVLCPYVNSGKTLVVFEVDAETLTYTKVIDTTTTTPNYTYFCSLTGDGTYAYISDNGPGSRIYKYDIATWTLQATYIPSLWTRIGSISLIDGYLYAATYVVSALDANGVTQYNLISKVDPVTMTESQIISFGAGVSSTVYPFAVFPWYKSDSPSRKKNFIKIGNYLYISFGRNATTPYSFWKIDTTNLSSYSGVNIPGFTTGLNTSVFSISGSDQLFILDYSTLKVCRYDTTSSSVIFTGTIPYNPLVSGSNLTALMSNDCRVLYTSCLGTYALGGKHTKQRF
jgi:hypothetical protein